MTEAAVGTVVGMSADQRARFLAVVDTLDTAVAGRPDLLASPVGFVVGALVGAANHDPEDAWRQVAGLGDLLAYLVMHVRDGQGTPEAIVAALIPPA